MKNPEGYRKDIEMLSDIIGFKEGIKVLDVGCGVGRHVIELSNIGAHCIGFDAAEDAIKVIEQIQNNFELNVEGVYGGACDLPFDDETFDVVMSNEFFEHVTDIDQALKEQIRVLRSGGRIIIEQANFLNPLVLLDLLVKYPLRTHGEYGGIKWLFTKSKVRENIYGTGWAGKDEDIHSRLWWRMKNKKVSKSQNCGIHLVHIKNSGRWIFWLTSTSHREYLYSCNQAAEVILLKLLIGYERK